jgi:hypothetical protein
VRPCARARRSVPCRCRCRCHWPPPCMVDRRFRSKGWDGAGLFAWPLRLWWCANRRFRERGWTGPGGRRQLTTRGGTVSSLAHGPGRRRGRVHVPSMARAVGLRPMPYPLWQIAPPDRTAFLIHTIFVRFLLAAPTGSPHRVSWAVRLFSYSSLSIVSRLQFPCVHRLPIAGVMFMCTCMQGIFFFGQILAVRKYYPSMLFVPGELSSLGGPCTIPSS